MPTLPRPIIAVVSLWFIFLTTLMLIPPFTASADNAVYADALAAGWENWSWDSTLDFAANTPTHSGAAALAVTYTGGWGGVYLHSTTLINGSAIQALRFWMHGGTTGGQPIRVYAVNAANQFVGSGVTLTAPLANTWTPITLTLTALGNPASVSGFVWQEDGGSARPTFYLDDISLITSGVPPATATPGGPASSGPALTINVAAGQHPISRDIYGMNFTDEALAQELRLPVRRWGGNRTSRYNWQIDVDNTANDWFFENYPIENPNLAALPNGSATDRFVEQDRRTGTQSIITVPLIGWTAKRRVNDHPFDCGFPVSRFGPQQRVDMWDPNCGNGVLPDGTLLTADPTDTSMPISPTFVAAWINHLTTRYGTAANGGVTFYALDNEPMLWNSTHRDVHPQPTSYDEMYTRTVLYAAAVKAADPSAKTLGPVVWGWPAYFYSALDVAQGGSWWLNPPDRLAHGNTPFIEWYLQQLRAYEQITGTRLLDYVDIHYYPQSNGVSLSPAGDAATQALRLRSTRSLWDATYTDESWINENIRLLPRMKEWVANNYPGTKLAITEYNWGALDHINGALAQADVLGLFGREGLDLATLWDVPAANQPGAYAFRMYLNYDGNGAAFGETSVSALSADPGQLALYAATRASDGALTLMVINKTDAVLSSTVTISNFTTLATLRAFRYSAANLNAITADAAQTVAANFQGTFPASSISLLVLTPAMPVGGQRLFLPLIRR